MKQVEKFVKRYNISDELALRLKQSVVLENEWRTDFDDLFQSCHPEFRTELLMAIHRPVLIRSSFFFGLNEGFLKRIVGALQILVCLEDDCIYRAGNQGDSMYVLNQGFVGMVSDAQLRSNRFHAD